MTRINAGINVKSLVDELLLAEHREIKRICNRLVKRSGNINGCPSQFTLGSGHELFFLRYGKYTYLRYIQIHKECINRGFNASDFSKNWDSYKEFPDLYNDYTPNSDGIKILIDRISLRISQSSKEYFHYYGKRISKDESINLLLNGNIC